MVGVPKNQLCSLLEEGTIRSYVNDTFDPIFTQCQVSTTNYFYYLPLMMQYSKTNCPSYLKESNYAKLQSNIQCVEQHTMKIVDFLAQLKAQGKTLTKAIVMDHMDWFTPEMADAEISALSQVMQAGGIVLWRSAAKTPWYNSIFEKHGFKVTADAVRPAVQFMDRVNMYASTYIGVKL